MRQITLKIVMCLLLDIRVPSTFATLIYKDLETDAIIIDDSAQAPDLHELELIPEQCEDEKEGATRCEVEVVRCGEAWCWVPKKGTCLTVEECFTFFKYVDDIDREKSRLFSFVENATKSCDGYPNKICCGDRIIPFARIRGKLSSKLALDTTTPLPIKRKECGNSSIVPTKDLERPALFREFPFATAVLKDNAHICSGSLISSKWILTAAHCVTDIQDLSTLSVNVGETDLSSPFDHINRGVDKIVYHASFTMRNLTHDIALLRLKEPVPFSEDVQPICLNLHDPFRFREAGVMIGWGHTPSGRPLSAALHTMKIRIFSPNKCDRKFELAGVNPAPVLSEGMLCVGADNGGNVDFLETCTGDSGSPLLINDENNIAVQVGFVSWAIGCWKKPAVYTRVDTYFDWIQKNMH